MKNKLNKNDQGFTIIEVMIVLAIAALILLVVFLAVPALQRSQRNSARKTDAARVATQVIDYVSSNNNVLPTTAANCDSIISASATLSQYSSLGACVQGVTLPTPAANTPYLEIMAANGSAGAATTNAMVIATKASCTPGSSNSVTFDSANSRKVALLYTAEAGGGWSWICTNIQ